MSQAVHILLQINLAHHKEIQQKRNQQKLAAITVTHPVPLSGPQ